MSKLACGTSGTEACEGREQRRRRRSSATLSLELAHSAARRGEFIVASELASGAICDIYDVENGACRAQASEAVEKCRAQKRLELEGARQALEQLLGAVQDYIPAAQVDLGHPASKRIAMAQLRAIDVLHPGTTRHG